MTDRHDLFDKVYLKYKEKLSNLDVSNPPLLITFAAVPGSGKRTISKMLESELQAVRINCDYIQELFYDLRGKRFYDGFILEKREFIYWLVRKIIKEYENKLVILDKSIDRSYEDIKDLTDELEIPFIVISLETGREELVKRLKKLYGDYSKNYINDLDIWIRQHKEFVDSKKYDVSIDTGKSDINETVKKIKKFLKKNS